MKLSALDGRVMAATPEFEDCRRLARAAKVPVRVVLAAASAAAAMQFGVAGTPVKRLMAVRGGRADRGRGARKPAPRKRNGATPTPRPRTPTPTPRTPTPADARRCRTAIARPPARRRTPSPPTSCGR